VMSLNMIPGFGKSGISRMSFLISSEVIISYCLSLRGRGRRIVFDAAGEGPNQKFRPNSVRSTRY
jgi:hypothetical protein